MSDFPGLGFEPQIFSNFPTHDLNVHGKKVKSQKSNQKKLLKKTGLYIGIEWCQKNVVFGRTKNISKNPKTCQDAPGPCPKPGSRHSIANSSMFPTSMYLQWQF